LAYRHFRSKEELCGAAVQREVENRMVAIDRDMKARLVPATQDVHAVDWSGSGVTLAAATAVAM